MRVEPLLGSRPVLYSNELMEVLGIKLGWFVLWWHAYTRVPSRLSVTLRQHETHTYTRYDSWRLASGDLAPDVVLINDRDLAEHTPLAHFTHNFDKRHRSTAHENPKKLIVFLF